MTSLHIGSDYLYSVQVHYDRVGNDGLFSHKEITVLYVPDLSDCLPSLDLWRDQWLAHKKAIAERENLQKLKNQVCQYSHVVLWLIYDKYISTDKVLSKFEYGIRAIGSSLKSALDIETLIFVSAHY